MRRIIESISICFWAATFILFCGWVDYGTDISGWLWFSTLMLAIFTTCVSSEE